MKSLIEKVKGILKLSTLSIPALITAGGFAGIATSLVLGSNAEKATIKEVNNSEIVQEIIKNEKNVLKTNHENGTISLEDYNSQMSYLNSDDFIKDILKSNENLNEYEKKLKDAKKLSYSALLYAIPLIAGMFSMIGVYTSGFFSFYDDKTIADKIIESAKRDFGEAQKLKELNQKKKEEDKLLKEEKEYNEEIL